MRKLFFGVLLPLLACSVNAQTPPDWWEAESRKAHYPSVMYHVGFVMGEQQAGETLENAMSRLKDEARVEAASSIRMGIEKNSVSTNRSELLQTTTQFDERVTEVFESTTRINVKMEIPGLHIDVWQHPKTKAIGAFAYVSHNELQRKTARQITVTLTKIEVALDGIDQMVVGGQKMKAREAVEQALRLFAEVEQAQKLLLALSEDEEVLSLDETLSLQKRLLAELEQLRHATAFYIDCQASIEGTPYPLLDKEVRGLLAEKGCHFMEEPEGADWIIIIHADVINIEHREGMAYFVFVDGDLSVSNGSSGKKMLEARLSSLETNNYDGIKGGDFKPEKAARIAYHSAARIIAESILKLIQE